MNKFRNLLLDVIKNEIKNEKSIAIFFSGGTDSLTCLFTCLELGLKPILYTFHLENYISEDGFSITDSCREYLLPLIEGENYPPYNNGLPNFV